MEKAHIENRSFIERKEGLNLCLKQLEGLGCHNYNPDSNVNKYCDVISQSYIPLESPDKVIMGVDNRYSISRLSTRG